MSDNQQEMRSSQQTVPVHLKLSHMYPSVLKCLHNVSSFRLTKRNCPKYIITTHLCKFDMYTTYVLYVCKLPHKAFINFLKIYIYRHIVFMQVINQRNFVVNLVIQALGSFMGISCIISSYQVHSHPLQRHFYRSLLQSFCRHILCGAFSYFVIFQEQNIHYLV